MAETDDAPKYDIVPRKGKGQMKREELQGIMRGLIDDARNYSETVLMPDRLKAEEYYKGEPFGNEEPGRSQFIVTEVRDAILGVLPSFMRILFGPERVVEYAARDPKKVALAKQQTDYAQYVFAEDNAGFLKTYSVLKDGLLKKLGIFMWSLEPARPRAKRLENITDEELKLLAEDDSIELTRVEKKDDGTACVDVVDKTRQRRVVIDAVPPEEWICSREARDDKSAVMVGRRRELTKGELLALGVSQEIIDEYGNTDESTTRSNQEEIARRPDDAGMQKDPEAGDANDKILWCVTYPYLDVDGDGEAELREICTIGTSYYPVFNRPAEERPFAVFTPDPEPHALIGGSYADRTMDLQYTKSMILRAIFDSLALSIYPRTAVVEGQVNIEDVLNTEIGATIRQRAPGMVQPFEHPFSGEKGLPLLDVLDSIKENRTGQNKGASGLDADALQSSTADAVNAAVTMSQEHKELIIRIFAEMTFKPLFRGIYRAIVRSETPPRLVKLRGSYVQVDTTDWDPEMDVVVNVAMGTSLVEQRVATLMEVASKQEQIIAQLGPANPLCTLSQLRYTYATILELRGFMDTASFFNEVPPDWQPPQTEPQMTPEQTLAQAQLQIEQMRTQKDLEIKQAELALKQRAQQHEQDLAEKKLAHDYILRLYAIDAQWGSTYSQKQLELDAQAEERALESSMDLVRMAHDRHDTEREHARADAAQQHEQELAEAQQAHDQEMAEQAAQQAAPEPSTE